MLHRTLLLLCLVGSQVAAQSRLWIVDSNKGAGYHYATINAALAAAKHGDRIYVRSGYYKSFALTKGVSITGGANVMIPFADIVIRHVPAGHTAAVRNLITQLECKVLDNNGVVHIQNVWAGSAIRIENSRTVVMNDCHTGRIQANRSTITMHACRVGPLLGYPTVRLTNSNLGAANCTIRGGATKTVSVPAITMEGWCQVRLTSDGNGIITTQDVGTLAVPAILGGSHGVQALDIDPRVKIQTFNNAPKYQGIYINAASVDIPLVSTVGAKIGKPLTVALSTKPHHRFYLAIGVPSAPTYFPRHRGSVWLDLRTAVLVRTGVMGSTGRVAYQLRVPNTIDLLGLTFLWQGLAGPSASQLILSSPAAYSHDL